MIDLVDKLRQAYPTLQFVASGTFRWQPNGKCIHYDPDQIAYTPESLLHELGHALLGHNDYRSDMDLLCKERDAWNMAYQLAKGYSVIVNEDHVEDCLDTYRDWLFKRSACPSCAMQGLQKTPREYTCLNCRHTWVVSGARFCRPYRSSSHKKQALE